MRLTDPEQRRHFLSLIVWGTAGLIGATLTSIFGASIAIPVLGSRERRWIELVDADRLSESPTRLELRYDFVHGWMSGTRSEVVYAFVRDGTPVVVSSRCTHLGCLVGWDESEKKFRCPCHGGSFDGEGKALSGPPPEALGRLQTKLQGSKVLARRA